MLLLRLLFIYIPGVLLGLVLLAALLIWQRGLVSRQDLVELNGIREQHGMAAVIELIRVELYGTSELATDPSYGRETASGRGHAPWVLRGNLDDRPRMISFALAPGWWAAYDTQFAALYQVWEGDLLFHGASYDYRHGPQPVAAGDWYIREDEPASWYLRDGPASPWQPAVVRYLGHEYGPERRTARLRFALTAGPLRIELAEYPDLRETDSTRLLLRRFERLSGAADIDAAYGWRGQRTLATGTVELPLDSATAIENIDYQRALPAIDSQVALGQQVIENSDCLSCHAADHQVVGPAWTRIAGRFRGNIQQESLAALGHSIREGSQGKWGQVPMPPHPQLSEAESRAAAMFILDHPEPSDEPVVPLDADGNPYAATRDFQINPRLDSVHPAFTLQDLLPADFQPKVGGMDFRADGKLALTSWDRDGGVFLVDLETPGAVTVTRIAEGLQEPLGLAYVGNRLFVLQKQELTELIDHDGDEVVDEYRAHSLDWPTSSNFHSFAFGLVHRGEYLYGLMSICVLPGGASCPEQLPTQGKLLRFSLADGRAEVVASGFRTPNGIALGPDDQLFVTDNQGDWLPANKLVHIREGAFYGSRAVPDPGVLEAVETAPAVWLAQDEIGNSPTQPLLLTEGPYAGQMIHGDVYNGGIKRVFLEQIDGALQGAAFQFSGGLRGGVNRLARGPDGAIYVGEVGNPPNWGEFGKRWYGVERLSYRGEPAFEILSVEARHDGFELALTGPLADGIALVPGDLVARQWFYYPTEKYGGPKYDPTVLQVASLALSDDRRRIRARIPGLKAGYVVYLRLDPRLRSAQGQSLWADEAWYTLNNLPASPAQDSADAATPGLPWTSLFDGVNFGGWRNYGGRPDEVSKWVISDGALELQPGRFGFLQMVSSYLFGGVTGDLIYATETFRNFELSLEWKISENGNSGIFYFVADENETTPWRTGLEMQVLDNDGHPDGQLHTHRAGDLYDLVAADPETVRPPGQWNEALIRVVDDRIEHWLNGVQVLAITRGSERWQQLIAQSKFADWPGFGTAEKGYIALQDHGDPVWYRNIRIRRLGD
jgi:cytochrome c551/c552